MSALFALFIRDLRLAVRVGGGAFMGVLFFLIVVALVPFAIGPDNALLRRIGPAILWLGALLASLLTLDQLFADDHEDGSLDLILMGSAPLPLAILAKACAHWLTAGLPLVIAAPLLGVFFNIDLLSMAAVALTFAGGHAGSDFPRTDRRGACRGAAPRRNAGAGTDLAADAFPCSSSAWRRRMQPSSGRCPSARRSRFFARCRWRAWWSGLPRRRQP